MQEEFYGWCGKVLRVDMTRGKVKDEPLKKEDAHSFIGGRGLNIKVLWDEVRPGIDPLSPENVLALAVGPFTGTPLDHTCRIEVSTLSPISGILGDGSSGGVFPAFLKYGGYDQIVVTGRSEKPKYLWIDDGKAELKDASGLWGKPTDETTDILVRDQGKDVKVACIGQGGENLARVASTIFDKYHSAARGSGAVWGSKNLKAIAVRGTKRPKIARPDEFMELVKKDRQHLINDEFHKKIITVYGTLFGFMHWNPKVKNMRSHLAPENVPENLTPDGMKKYEVGRLPCYNCATGCGILYEVPTGKYKTKGGRLEFETMGCCGTNTGVMDPEAIYLMDNLGDKYGLDVMALGHAIGLAKELYERGIITKKDTGGMALEWDDVDGTIEMVHMIAKREGFGDKMAEGCFNLARMYGQEAMSYCMHIKGLLREPASTQLIGLLYATSTRGADHLRGNMIISKSPYNMAYVKDLEEKGLVPKDTVGKAITGQRVFLLSDILTRCKCGVINWPDSVPLIFEYPLFEGVVKLFSAGTGWETSSEELVRALDRIYNLERAFIVRQGITRKHDRYTVRPENVGTSKANAELAEHERLLDGYYKERGWDLKTGIPTRRTLEELGLKYVADELESHGPYPEWVGPPLEKTQPR